MAPTSVWCSTSDLRGSRIGRIALPVGGARAALLAVLGWGLAGCAASAAPAEMERIVAALGLAPGMTVADVGAGDGDHAVELSRIVGEAGEVIATEVEQDLVDELRELAAEKGLVNLTAVLGSQDATGLVAGCCDAILLRLVYHHFQQPAAMRADLRAALRPGGRIVVIDILPQESWRVLPGVPDRGGHGIPPEELAADMTGDGFELLARFDDWGDEEERYCMVFLRRPDGTEEQLRDGPTGEGPYG